MACNTNRGLWSTSGVPHKGWKCIGIDDTGSLSKNCDMCQSQTIRYVHIMEHPNYSSKLEVGCVCAENMENTKIKPKKRQASFVRRNKNRVNWTSNKNWKKSKKGNLYINSNKCFVIVYNYNGAWGTSVEDRVTTKKYSSKYYSSANDAKLKAYDIITTIMLMRI